MEDHATNGISDASEPLAGVIARAKAAYGALAEIAETIDDEWQYVEDLSGAYLASLDVAAAVDPEAPVPAEVAAAVDEAIAEIGLIDDPHRAIDWLSTFPHVVAIALGIELEGAAGPSRPAADGEGDDGDSDYPEDSPFRALLGRDEL